MLEASCGTADELIECFVDESVAALHGLPVQLQAHFQSPESAGHINAVFRAVHSIKGNASFFGFEAIQSFSHALENTLDDIRESRAVLSDDLRRALVRAFDYLEEMIQGTIEGRLIAALQPLHIELLARIDGLCDARPSPAETEESLLAELREMSADMGFPGMDAPGMGDGEMGATAVGAAAFAAALMAEEEAPIELSPAARSRFVRVKEERFDELLAQVADLQASCRQLQRVQEDLTGGNIQASQLGELKQATVRLDQQVAELRISALALRRVAVGGLFARFPRMVRNLAAQLQKRVEIHLDGEDVELDKSLLEELDAPLTHIIRNVVDHGLEPPAERRARGVSEVGNLWLSAEQSDADITIVVRDDGRGIDPARVRRRACEKGMLSSQQAAALSDADAIELIFEPGFSTAERISEISGRGVGLDVVRSVVRGRGGDVYVTTRVGAGTTFRLVLPR